MEEEEEKTPRKRGWFWRWTLKAALFVVVALVAAVFALPYVVQYIPIPELEFDLAPYLKGKVADLVESKKATADVTVGRTASGAFRVRAKGRLLDWPYSATADVRLGFIRADGTLSLSLDRTDWRLDADFSAKGARDWRFSASVRERKVSQGDEVLAAVLSRLALPSVSNLVFSGTFSLDADGSSTPRRPVPAWSARGSLKDVDAEFSTAGGRDVAVKGLRIKFGVDAIADHKDIAPLHPRAAAVEFAGFTLSNVYASVRATERSYLVTEAGADCGGGNLRLYSLFLDPKSLTTGATIFMDGVDAGAVLSRLYGFHGEASGRLHGKLPFFLKNGKVLHLKDAYLFSKPGETGKVRISDARPILYNLELAGVPASERDNLSKALADLDYNVLKVELKRGEDGEDSALELVLEGSATRGATTVPVKLDVTFHGDFDTIINTGINISKLSGRKK